MSNGKSSKEQDKEEKGKILRVIKKECKEVSVSRKRPRRMGRSGKRKHYNSVSVVKKEDLDGTLAASAYSQEDYQHCRRHKVPARSFLIGGTGQEDMYIFVKRINVFTQLYPPFLLSLL